MSNVGSKTPVGVIEQMPMAKLMESYDSLPTRFKELYDLMPVPMNPEEFHAMIRAYGPERAYSLMYDFVNENFPTWNGGVKRKNGK